MQTSFAKTDMKKITKRIHFQKPVMFWVGGLLRGAPRAARVRADHPTTTPRWFYRKHRRKENKITKSPQRQPCDSNRDQNLQNVHSDFRMQNTIRSMCYMGVKGCFRNVVSPFFLSSNSRHGSYFFLFGAIPCMGVMGVSFSLNYIKKPFACGERSSLPPPPPPPPPPLSDFPSSFSSILFLCPCSFPFPLSSSIFSFLLSLSLYLSGCLSLSLYLSGLVLLVFLHSLLVFPLVVFALLCHVPSDFVYVFFSLNLSFFFCSLSLCHPSSVLVPAPPPLPPVPPPPSLHPPVSLGGGVKGRGLQQPFWPVCKPLPLTRPPYAQQRLRRQGRDENKQERGPHQRQKNPKKTAPVLLFENIFKTHANNVKPRPAFGSNIVKHRRSGEKNGPLFRKVCVFDVSRSVRRFARFESVSELQPLYIYI